MSDFTEKNFGLRNLDLFQFAVLNPQIAILSFLNAGQELVKYPQKMKDAQQNLLDRLVELQRNFARKICQDKDDDCIDLNYDSKKEKFTDNVFDNNPAINFAQQFHSTISEWMVETLDGIEDADPNVMRSAKFFLKQYIDMMSPKNFPFLNPNVWKEALDSGGESLKNGMEMFLNDLKNGSISTNDRDQFEIGKNIATTPGKVIFQNDIVELIQYEATTKQVFAKPILFVPPWINKFYILDLTPENSLVKWAVDHGFTVFMISWVNPDKKHRNIGFENYAMDGVVAALNKIYDVTKSKSVHTLGYCVGGTLISSLLAYLAHPSVKNVLKTSIESATLLTTLLDFEHAGDMAIFMSENYLQAIKSQLGEKGVLDGNVLYNTFSALKAKDMIWRYFVNSYMLGKKPGPHEILFWNSDPTNLTEAMQTFLSIDLYRDNLLKTGTLKMFGVPMDLKLVKTPVYMVSMKKDHLVPWQATFNGMKLFSGPVRFVLGGSGHVAGAINHPSRNKYCYWINENATQTAQEWFDSAVEIAGSWWNDWLKWLEPMMGALVDPPKIKDAIRDAPGEYVLVRN